MNKLSDSELTEWPVEVGVERELSGKVVEVTTKDSRKVEGTVYTVDPLKHSIVLLSADFQHADIVMGPSVSSVKVLREAEEAEKERLNTLFLSRELIINKKSSEERKTRMLAWFQQNRIPVQELESESLSVLGVVTIARPYTVDSCYSTNELVLSRIRAIVNALPSPKTTS